MKTSATLDPQAAYTHIGNSELIESLGPLPLWVLNPEFFPLSLREALETQYGFGSLIPIEGGTVTSDFTFIYPGDPPLLPLIVIQRGDETFIQYQYAIVALLEKSGSVFVSRMD